MNKLDAISDMKRQIGQQELEQTLAYYTQKNAVPVPRTQ